MSCRSGWSHQELRSRSWLTMKWPREEVKRVVNLWEMEWETPGAGERAAVRAGEDGGQAARRLSKALEDPSDLNEGLALCRGRAERR